MESFHWGEYFVTELPKVDAQHRHLVSLINQFGSLLTENEVQLEDVDRLYTQLADYAVYHFQEEEKLMHKVNVDPRHLTRHIDVHKGFLDEISFIYSNTSIDNLDQAKIFLKFLMHWLAYHILGQDQDMAKQINAIQSGVSPFEAYDTLKQEKNSSTEPLIEALNGLFAQVSMRNRELKQLNDSLEEKVALRTKELFEANLQLEKISLTDVLTGLPNRRHAMLGLSRLWEKSSENNLPLTCIMIDVDHFKAVNDTHGHDAGDLVLKELAKTLRYSFRTDDLVCRLGGDEFFVICPDTNKDDAMYIAESTRKAVSGLRVPTGSELWCGSISVGVASRLPDMKKCTDVIKVADKSVYAAKRAGKNCVISVA